MAFVIINVGISESEEEIKKSILEKCRKELKEYEIPKHIQLVDSLPYTPNGKYDFRELERIGNEYVKSLA